MARKVFDEGDKSPCERCELCTVCHSPKIRPSGKGGLKIAVIIDKPTVHMDDAGSLNEGPDYRFLSETFKKIGIDLYADCWLIPVISCRTPKDRQPTTNELKMCRGRFDKYMDAYNPNVVICLGKEPFGAVISHRIKGRLTGTPYTDFYGCLIPDQEKQKWITCTYSVEELMEVITYSDGGKSKPLYIRDKAVYKMWLDHLYRACSAYAKPVEILDYNAMCKTTTDVDTAVDWITEALSWDRVSFDYETNSLKCYREGSKIKSVSISNGSVSYSFPMFDDKCFHSMFRRLMTNGSKKISHNTSFEYQWTKQKLGYFFSTPSYDTMLMAHCINARKPTGLKYEVYTRLGVIGYDSAADEFLSSIPEEREKYGDNAFNRIDEAPLEDILLYNALDSLFTYKIYQQQILELDEFQMKGYEFLNESMIWLTQAQITGFHINMARYTEVAEQLDRKIKELEIELLQCDELKLWDGDSPFNYNSGPQLSHMLFDIMKLKATVKTEKGAPSVNVEALAKIDSPLVHKILEIRKYQKLFGTYIHQFALEQTDGKIHAFTYLNRVETFRSSMGSINIQNQPKRDEDAKKLITSLVLPSPGRKLVGYDLKGAEVSVGACNSMDRNLISYVNDLSKDMHRDLAMKGFILEKEKVSGTIRKGMKNRLTFPTMYGSYYKQTAPDMYEFAKEVGLLEHLAEHGIKTYPQFVEHIKSIEEYFWQKMFPRHKKWMEEQWEHYQKHGYVVIPTGFYAYGPMRRNNSFNTPVQGSAYHCNQRTFNKVAAFIEEKHLESRLMFQIHDAIYIDMVPEEEELLDWAVWYYGTQEIKEAWSWLVTTLYYEKEAGEVNADWSTLKEMGLLGEGGRVAL